MAHGVPARNLLALWGLRTTPGHRDFDRITHRIPCPSYRLRSRARGPGAEGRPRRHSPQPPEGFCRGQGAHQEEGHGRSEGELGVAVAVGKIDVACEASGKDQENPEQQAQPQSAHHTPPYAPFSPPNLTKTRARGASGVCVSPLSSPQRQRLWSADLVTALEV